MYELLTIQSDETTLKVTYRLVGGETVFTAEFPDPQLGYASVLNDWVLAQLA